MLAQILLAGSGSQPSCSQLLLPRPPHPLLAAALLANLSSFDASQSRVAPPKGGFNRLTTGLAFLIATSSLACRVPRLTSWESQPPLRLARTLCVLALWCARTDGWVLLQKWLVAVVGVQLLGHRHWRHHTLLCGFRSCVQLHRGVLGSCLWVGRLLHSLCLEAI